MSVWYQQPTRLSVQLAVDYMFLGDERRLCVVAGIVITVKQRQEFRIRLQKRARRVAERKLENYVEEQTAKSVSYNVE